MPRAELEPAREPEPDPALELDGCLCAVGDPLSARRGAGAARADDADVAAAAAAAFCEELGAAVRRRQQRRRQEADSHSMRQPQPAGAMVWLRIQ